MCAEHAWEPLESFEQGSEVTDNTPPAEGHQTWGGRRHKAKAQRSMGRLRKSSTWDTATWPGGLEETLRCD